MRQRMRAAAMLARLPAGYASARTRQRILLPAQKFGECCRYSNSGSLPRRHSTTHCSNMPTAPATMVTCGTLVHARYAARAMAHVIARVISRRCWRSAPAPAGVASLRERALAARFSNTATNLHARCIANRVARPSRAFVPSAAWGSQQARHSARSIARCWMARGAARLKARRGKHSAAGGTPSRRARKKYKRGKASAAR